MRHNVACGNLSLPGVLRFYKNSSSSLVSTTQSKGFLMLSHYPVNTKIRPSRL